MVLARRTPALLSESEHEKLLALRGDEARERLGVPVISMILAALVVCADVDDTAAIQNALNAGDVELSGNCAVVGAPGIRIPGSRTLNAGTSVIRLIPGCTTCRMLETVVGASNITIRGGVWRGDRIPSPSWKIGLRIDTAHYVTVEDAIFEDWLWDGVWIGGNPPYPSNVLVRNVTIRNSKRNNMSIVSGRNIRIERATFEAANCNPDWRTATPPVCTTTELNMPLCGLDIEPSGPTDRVDDVRITDSRFLNNQKCGVFLQSGKGVAGEKFVLIDNVADGNGTWGFALNQQSRVIAAFNTVWGGTLSYSAGAGVRDLRFFWNAASGATGNGMNLAGAWDPIVTDNNFGGRPLAIIAIPNPAMNGVAGNVVMRGNQ